MVHYPFFHNYRAIVNKVVETSDEIDDMIELLVKTKVSSRYISCIAQ